jgi:hypothetical protein
MVTAVRNFKNDWLRDFEFLFYGSEADLQFFLKRKNTGRISRNRGQRESYGDSDLLENDIQKMKEDDNALRQDYAKKYDYKKNLMFCILYIEHNKKNTFTTGADRFKRDAIVDHLITKDHKQAVLDIEARS